MTPISDFLLDKQLGSQLSADSTDTIYVNTDVGLSGKFIRLDRDGKLTVVLDLVKRHQQVQNDLALVHAELRGCNHPVGLRKFALRCGTSKSDFERELRCAVKQLESARGLLETKLAAIERQLEQFEVTIPTLHGSADLVSYPQQKIVPRQPRPTLHSPTVARRNAVIDRSVRSRSGMIGRATRAEPRPGIFFCVWAACRTRNGRMM